EGIHLRALGHGPNPFIMALDPLNEFHAEAVKLFTSMFASIEEQSAETFENAEITESGLDLEAAGLKRPTATWTYLVKDNPFGTDADAALRRLRRKRRRSDPDEEDAETEAEADDVPEADAAQEAEAEADAAPEAEAAPEPEAESEPAEDSD